MDLQTEIVGLNGAAAVSHNALNRGSRGQFLAFASTNEVPDAIKTQLENGQLKLADTIIYGIVSVSGKTIHVFEPQDTKLFGIRNLDRRQLPKNKTLLVSSIQVLAAYTEKVGSTRADDDEIAMAARFVPIDTTFPSNAVIGRTAGGAITVVDEGASTALATQVGSLVLDGGSEPFAGLETGTLTLRANRKDLIDEMPLTAFKASPWQTAPGLVVLDNPRYIQDSVDIEIDINLGVEVEADGDNDNVWLLVALRGTGTIPA